VADAAEQKERKVRAGSKQAQLIEMLRSPNGARIVEIVGRHRMTTARGPRRHRRSAGRNAI
jgi:hypothetical protein